MRQFFLNLAVLGSMTALVLCFTACGGSDSEETGGGTNNGGGDITNGVPDGGTAGRTTLSGNWNFHMVVTGVADEGGTMVVHQSGGSLTGMLVEVPLTGNVSGSTVTISAVSDSGTIYLRGTVNAALDSMGGQVDLDNDSGTPMGTGTWTATR